MKSKAKIVSKSNAKSPVKAAKNAHKLTAKPAKETHAASAKKSPPPAAKEKTAAPAKNQKAPALVAPAPVVAASAAGKKAGGKKPKPVVGSGYVAQALAQSHSERGSKSQLCRVIGCTQPATTAGYSRLCYIKYWKQIKQKDEILAQGTLQRFIKELVDKYPEKVILAIRTDLASNEAYGQMIRDLDLYGGIDELEHVSPTLNEDEESQQENDLEDIKKGIDKEDDLF